MVSDLSPLLGFAAGLLSMLSPCVLPLLPIVIGAAQSRHRWGPAALGAGLAVSFTLAGLFVATIGFAIGLDEDVLRRTGGTILILFGLLLLVPAAQLRLASASGGLSNWANGMMDRFDQRGLGGQAVLGMLLGVVWVPCVGPTLGAASVVAAQGENLHQVALVMIAFAVGAAAPLIVIGLSSARLLASIRDRLGKTGRGGRMLFGSLLLLLGALTVTDLDRAIEAWLTQSAPDWLIELTTRF